MEQRDSLTYRVAKRLNSHDQLILKRPLLIKMVSRRFLLIGGFEISIVLSSSVIFNVLKKIKSSFYEPNFTANIENCFRNFLFTSSLCNAQVYDPYFTLINIGKISPKLFPQLVSTSNAKICGPINIEILFGKLFSKLLSSLNLQKLINRISFL